MFVKSVHPSRALTTRCCVVRAASKSSGKGFGTKAAPTKAARNSKKGHAVPDKSPAQQEAKVEAVAPPVVVDEPLPAVPDVATPRPADIEAVKITEPVKADAEPVIATVEEAVNAAVAAPVEAAAAEPVKAAAAAPVEAAAAAPIKAAVPPPAKPVGSKPASTSTSIPPTPATPWSTTLLDELKDTSRLGQRGEAYVVAQFGLLGLVIAGPTAFDGALAAIGWVAIVAAGAMAVAAQQVLGTNLTPLPEPRPTHTLVTSGVYSLVRHPMYGALVLLALGVAAVTDDGTRYVLAGLLAVALSLKADFEERELMKRYGREYDEYKRSSKKMLPYLW